MERPLTEWERGVIEALASLDADDGAFVRESLPHLVVTGVCECGCASFNVRDHRHPTQPHQLRHFSNGQSLSGTDSIGFVLWLGPDGRPISVDVDPTEHALPDPSTVIVSSPYEQP
jgi:hypothetical protein